MSSNRKKLILKFLSILPQFIFKRIINKFDLDQQNKNVEPSFSEIVSNCENINKSLFDGENELFKKYLDKSKVYGEYGVGISTVFANRYKNKDILLLIR